MCNVKLLVTGLAALIVLSILLAPAAYASNTQQVILTVEQNIVSNHLHTPPNTTFTYQLTPTSGNGVPMPHGSSVEGYTFTISGANEIQLESIHFDTPGVFTYELRCVTDTRPGLTVDPTVYTIQVYVTDDLQVTTTVYVNPGVKVPNIRFTHVYNVMPGPPPPGDDLPDPEDETTWWTPPGVIINENTPIITPIAKQEEPPKPETITEPGTPDNEPELPIQPPTPAETITPDEPGTPMEPGTPGTSPKTGDFSNQLLWVTLITISVTLLILLVYVDRRLKRRRGS